jgi:branched-chain amino acid aminotransferase
VKFATFGFNAIKAVILGMHPYISFDREILQPTEPRLSALSSATLFGRGVFTTIAVKSGKPFLWEKHWRRLSANASSIGIKLPGMNGSETYESLIALIDRNSVSNGRARITIFDEGSSVMWPIETSKQATVLIMSRDAKPLSKTLKVTISPFLVNSTSPLAGIKSCNYLENIIAAEEARARGFSEAIRLNERGEVTSGAMSNVFWLIDGRLQTPALSTGCLPGTTREYIMEKLECEESIAGPDIFQMADAVFLTSSGLGVKKVGAIDARAFEPVEHEILRIIESI